MITQIICDDLARAKANRERISQGIGNDFYDSQDKATDQWILGGQKPNSVILGDLPILGSEQTETKYIDNNE